MIELTVSIPAKQSSYPIVISSGISGGYIKSHAESGGFTVVDSKVWELYKDIMPKEQIYIFHASEDNKTLASVEGILKFLLESKGLRDCKVLAVGGGITGDTVGFAASLYMRGVKVIQMPTTLLSMVDSSVGGKTGVNFSGIKNNIGSFYQPSQVIIDTDFLNTLSGKEFLNGLAESIKIAATCDNDFFNYLKDNKSAVLKRDKDVLSKVIAKSCTLKSKIVEADEKESGVRKILNFGHTVAHGVETDSHHNISHGFAVAIGMVYETKYALQNNIADDKVYNDIINILSDYGYDIEYKVKDINLFLEAIRKDKKATESGISLALTGQGLTGKIANGVKPEDLVRLFSE